MFSKKVLTHAIGFGLFGSLSVASFADNHELNPLVVTATPTPTNLQDLGSSVTVISQKDIQQKQYITLSDALVSVPGIQVVQLGGLGSQTSVFSRGTNSNHTLVLVDGVEMNDPSAPTGAFDFGNFLLEDVESIEVVRGSHSVLYGADAIGAVIQIHTRKGSGNLTPRLKAEMGTKSTHHGNIGVSGAANNFDYNINASLLESDGDSAANEERIISGSDIDDDGYQNKALSANLGYQFNQQLSSRVTARYIDTKTDIDGGFDFSGNAVEDLDANNTSEQWYIGANLLGNFFSGVWQPTLAYTYTDVSRENNNERQSIFGNESNAKYEGEKNKIKFQNDFYLIDNHIISAGYEYEKEQYDSQGQSVFGSFILTQSDDAERQNRAIFLHDQFTLTDKLHLTAGIRNDNTGDFSAETTYGLTVNYQLSQDTRLRTAYGTGFKAPSLYEMYGYTPSNFGNAYRGNSNLKPETSKNWEIGIDQNALDNRLQTQFTAFKNDIDDLITTVFLPSFDSTSENQKEAELYGLEAAVDFQINPKFMVAANYTYTHSEDQDDKELVRRPKNQANLDLTYQLTTLFDTVLSLNYIGSRKDIDGLGSRVELGGYSVVNWMTNYQVTPTTRLYTRVENLTNKHYEPAYGYQGTGFAGIIGIETALK